MQGSDNGPKVTSAAEIPQGQSVTGNPDDTIRNPAESDADVVESFDLDDIEIIESKVFG